MTNTAPNSLAQRRGQSPLPMLDGTLELLSRAEPRSGLEQRVLVRLASAPRPQPWYRQLSTTHWRSPWILAAASVAIVATSVTYGIVHHHAAVSSPAPMSVTAHSLPRRPADVVTPASSVAVPDHPLQQSTLPFRHRGVHRAFRAQHPRTVLPPGTVAPSHPHLLSVPQ